MKEKCTYFQMNRSMRELVIKQLTFLQQWFLAF